jgi:hypothetical protein
MKSLVSVVLLLGASLASHAAITITITPGVSGTSFSVTQTAPNPLIALGATTVGYVAGIALAPGAFDQDIGSVGFVDTFSPRLGTLTDLFGGASGDIVGFSFFFDVGSSLYRPSLNLDSIISLGSNQAHQMQFSGGTTSEIGIDFSRFVLGTYVATDSLFGEITTVVIPEPNSIILASIGTGLIAFRRRRVLPQQQEAEQGEPLQPPLAALSATSTRIMNLNSRLNARPR